MKVCGGDTDGVDLGPMISPEALSRAKALIQSGVDQGAKILLDGRDFKVCDGDGMGR